MQQIIGQTKTMDTVIAICVIVILLLLVIAIIYCFYIFTTKITSKVTSIINLEARIHLNSLDAFNPLTIPSLLKQKVPFKSIIVSIPTSIVNKPLIHNSPTHVTQTKTKTQIETKMGSEMGEQVDTYDTLTHNLVCNQHIDEYGCIIKTILSQVSSNNNNNKIPTKVTVVESNHCLYPVTTPDITHVAVFDWQEYNHNVTLSLINHNKIRIHDDQQYLYAPTVYTHHQDNIFSLAAEGECKTLSLPYLPSGYCFPSKLLDDQILQQKLNTNNNSYNHSYNHKHEHILAHHLFLNGIKTYCIDDVIYQYGRVYIPFTSNILPKIYI